MRLAVKIFQFSRLLAKFWPFYGSWLTWDQLFYSIQTCSTLSISLKRERFVSFRRKFPGNYPSSVKLWFKTQCNHDISCRFTCTQTANTSHNPKKFKRLSRIYFLWSFFKSPAIVYPYFPYWTYPWILCLSQYTAKVEISFHLCTQKVPTMNPIFLL